MQTTGNAELDAYCKKHGIPMDRMMLVRRNLQLTEAVKGYRKALLLTYGLLHEVWHIEEHKNGITWNTCQKDLCVKMRGAIVELDKLNT